MSSHVSGAHFAVGPVHSEVRLVHYGTRLFARFSHVCPRLSVSRQELGSLHSGSVIVDILLIGKCAAAAQAVRLFPYSLPCMRTTT